MNKKELIAAMSEINGKSLEDSRVIVNTLQLVAWKELRERGEFTIPDLVKIEAVDKPARSGESLGVKWHKPAHKALKAKIIGKAKRMFQEG